MSGKAAIAKGFRAIDWDALAKVVVSEEGRRELNNLRNAFEEVNRTIETKFSMVPKPIDWSFYRERLNPAVVDIFQKSYESLKIPPFEDKFTPEYRKKHEALLAKAKEQADAAKKEIERIDAEIKLIQEQKEAIKSMTVDEYFAKHPEVKAKIDEEIKNDNWGY